MIMILKLQRSLSTGAIDKAGSPGHGSSSAKRWCRSYESDQSELAPFTFHPCPNDREAEYVAPKFNLPNTDFSKNFWFERPSRAVSMPVRRTPTRIPKHKQQRGGPGLKTHAA